MYEAHDLFVPPESEDVRIWRYMDFTKLVSLIDSRCLYFTRADEVDDSFEGSLPKMNVCARQSNDECVLSFLPLEHREGYLKSKELLKPSLPYNPQYYAINCWHMNEHESAAMWKLYLKCSEGIALQSTYKKLRDAIIDDEKVYIGLVKYLDYDSERIEVSNNFFSPFVHKRKSFEHEREVRALIAKWPTAVNDMGLYQETITHGVKIKVDIEVLIEKIYVAPSTPDWFSELIRAVVQRYGYNFEVVPSKLDEKAVF